MAYDLVRLGDVVEVNPRLARSTNLQADTKVRFVPMAAVDEINGQIADVQYRPFREVSKGYTNFQSGDVLFAKITPCMQNGKSAIFEGDNSQIGFGSTEFYVIRAGDRIQSRFIYHLVRQETFREKARANFTGTAGQQRVPRDFLENYCLPLPPLDEQQRIVDILDRAASIQHLRQAADEKLKQIIPALFLDMFGDPATNPKGWQKSVLGGLINIRSSVRLPDLASEAEELCIGADAISSGDGKLLFQPTVGSVMPKSGKYFFHQSDVLYSKIRPYLCKAWLADCAGYCSADIYAIECIEQLTPHFLKYLLLSKDFTGYAVAQSSRASMPKVNREALSAYEFPLPPVELQKEFSARAERVLSLAKLSDEASGNSDLSMSSLSSQFFSAA
jgi:type I restriction enzyme S subunit